MKTCAENGRDAMTRGMTLMEVVAAVAIVGLVMGSALGVVRYTIVARNLVDNWSLAEKEGPVILDMVEEDLRSALYYNVEPEKVFRGRDNGVNDVLDLVCQRRMSSAPEKIASTLAAPADYLEVGYRLRPNPADNTRLEMWRREDIGIDDDTTQGGRYELLTRNAIAFDVTYFKKAGEEAEEFYEWPPDEETFGLPYRMRMRLTMQVDVRDVPLENTPRRLTYVRNFVFPKDVRFAMKRRMRPYIPEILGPLTAEGQAGEGENGQGQNGRRGGNQAAPMNRLPGGLNLNQLGSRAGQGGSGTTTTFGSGPMGGATGAGGKR